MEIPRSPERMFRKGKVKSFAFADAQSLPLFLCILG